MYAVFETGGKQYNVAPGDLVNVEKVTAQPGDKVIFENVLLIKEDGKDVQVGRPYLAKTIIETEVMDQGKQKKIRVFSFTHKGHQTTIGHRQPFTCVKIVRIGQE